MVIVRDSSNFPIIIFPLLSSYFPTVTAAVHVRMHESIVLSRIDCMADWLVQVHTLNAFVVITKTLTTLYSSERSELHFWNFVNTHTGVKIQFLSKNSFLMKTCRNANLNFCAKPEI